MPYLLLLSLLLTLFACSREPKGWPNLSQRILELTPPSAKTKGQAAKTKDQAAKTKGQAAKNKGLAHNDSTSDKTSGTDLATILKKTYITERMMGLRGGFTKIQTAVIKENKELVHAYETARDHTPDREKVFDFELLRASLLQKQKQLEIIRKQLYEVSGEIGVLLAQYPEHGAKLHEMLVWNSKTLATSKALNQDMQATLKLAVKTKPDSL